MVGAPGAQITRAIALVPMGHSQGFTCAQLDPDAMTSQMNAETFQTLLRTHEPPWLLAVSGTDEEAVILDGPTPEGRVRVAVRRWPEDGPNPGLLRRVRSPSRPRRSAGTGGLPPFDECLDMLGTVPTIHPIVFLVLNSNRLLDGEPPRELEIAADKPHRGCKEQPLPRLPARRLRTPGRSLRVPGHPG